MAKVTMKTFKAGALRSISGEAIGLTTGFALSRGFEEQVYCAFPEVFGVNTGPGALSEGQERNRQLLLAGAVVVGWTGAVATRRNRPVSMAFSGFAAGESWHLANSFGLNYDPTKKVCFADNFRDSDGSSTQLQNQAMPITYGAPTYGYASVNYPGVM